MRVHSDRRQSREKHHCGTRKNSQTRAMLIKDYDLYSLADEDLNQGVRGLVRTTRRAVKRCWLDRKTIDRPRFFCQNIGGCGSTYIIQLLRDNGIENAFHERAPDLNEIGVEHFENPISRNRLIRILRYTRHDVFFEANNRFFTLTQELALAFPNAKFLHLYRDPAEAVRSNMSKPNVEPYLKENVRLRSSVGGPPAASSLEKFCHHWRIANQRLYDDLQAVSRRTGRPYLTLSFEDLIAGRLDSFEEFTGLSLTRRTRPPVNQRAPRAEGRFPEFEKWSPEQQQALTAICGPLLQTLSTQARRPA